MEKIGSFVGNPNADGQPGGAATVQATAATSMHYGDLVYLHVESIDGYISSTGFTNTNVYVQKDNYSRIFCRNSRDFVFQIQPKMNFDARKDYRQAVKFYQSNVITNKAEDEEGSKKGEGAAAAGGAPGAASGGEHRKVTDPVEHQKQLMKQMQEQQSYKKKLTQLKKKMADEEDTNKKLVERRKGEFVTYGSEIQLFHVDSETYLCAKKTCADIEKTCNKVELIDKPSSAIYFKILPRYKYRQEGEKIKYGDQIIFLNVKINLYLHVTETQIPIEEPLALPLLPGQTKNEITPIIIDRRCPPINYVPTHEVNVATNFSRFKAEPYCLFDEDDKRFLRGGVVAKLKHSELGGLLSSDDNDFTDDGLAEVFLWVYKGKEGDIENFNTQSLFEIEIATDHLKGQIARSTAKEDGKKQEKEDENAIVHKFRMRHLNTGRLVTVQEIMFAGQKISTLGLAEHLNLRKNDIPGKTGDTYSIDGDMNAVQELEDNTLFNFISTNVDNDPRIKNFHCVKIQHCKTELYLSMKKRALFTVKKEENHTDEDHSSLEGGGTEFHGKLYEPLDDEEINHANRHVIELKQQAGYEDAFFIQILDRETLKDILFVHTSVGILKKNIPYLCEGKPEIPKERFHQMDVIMKKLDQFAKCEENSHVESNVEGEDQGSSNDFDMNTLKDKIIKRQKIMRELYLVEYIVQTLYYPFASKSFNLLRLTQDDLITRLCKNAYVLLKSAVGGYEINEMYASQWINFFFMQAMKTNKENDIFAQSTVEELLSDNQKLLETQITPSIIKQFINLCKQQGKDKKLVKLLTALCTCYGKAVEHNQMQIVKFLLEDRDTREKLMMPIRLREQGVEVKIEGQAYISLGMLEDYSMSRDNSRIYKYFKSLVDLAANLNIGRNSHAFNQLTTIFGFDPTFQIVCDPNLPYDMRSYFLKLMNAMHLDREPLQPLAIPTTTVVMNEIPSFYELVPSADNISYPIKFSSVDIPPQLLKLKDFVLDFLRTEHGVQDLSNKKKNKFVYNMILSLNFMLTHGFYKDQDELNNLALPLIMLLDGSDDVYDEDGAGGEFEGNSSDRYKYTQKNEIILMSKKIQCDCLIFISQLELDGRAELYLSKLKRDYEMQSEAAKKEEESKKILQIGGPPDEIPQFGQGENIMSLDQLKGSTGQGIMQAINRSKSLIDSKKQQQEEKHHQSKHEADSHHEANQILSTTNNIDFLDTVASMKGFESEIGDIYICILFDLMLYKYQELNETAFELLIRFFNRKSSLIECLSNIQILESKKSIDILNKVKVYQNQLKVFQSEAEMYMNESDKSSREQKLRCAEIFSFLTRYCSVTNTPKINEDAKKQLLPQGKSGGFFGGKKSSGFEQDEPEKLEDLLGKLKDEEYVKDNLRPEDDSLTPEQEDYIMYLTLPASENKENQRLMRSFDMDDFAIYFIRYRTEEKDAQVDEHIAFMKQCYRFLIKFVRGNVENQHKLREHLEDFLKDIEKHSLAILLIYEIFKDNKKFLNINASKILKQIVNAAEKSEMTDFKKGQMYKLLTVFCRYKDKLVRANQQDIVVFMTDKGPQSNILYLFTSEGFKDINKLIQQQKAVTFPQEEEASSSMALIKNSNNSNKAGGNGGDVDKSKRFPTIFMSNQIINIMSCVELLSLCCEGKSDLAEQKCQTEVITLENCSKIIEACEYCWPLKQTFVDYVWQCFLDSNSKTIFVDQYAENVTHVWKIAEVILNDMINIIDNMNKESDQDVYIKFPYKAGTTLREQSVNFLTDSILVYFKYMMKRKDIHGNSNADTEAMLIVFATHIVKFYYSTNDQEAKKKAYNVIGYMYSKQSLSKYLDNLKHPLIGLHPGNLANQDTQKSEGKTGESPMILDALFLEHSESSKLSQMLATIQNSPDVKHMVEKEFEELVLWITNIELRVKDIVVQSDQYSEESFENLTFASIVTAILQMLDKKQVSKQLHVIGLQIIRKLIEVENRDFVTPAADWDTDDYVQYKPKIVAKQDAMVEIGSVQFLCKHIAEVDDDQLLEQCLLIGIALLLGGNTKAQEAFLTYFQDQDEYNRVLNKLKQTMLKEFDQAKTYLQEKNAKLSMYAKTQERMQQIKMRKSQKPQAAAEEEQNKMQQEEEIVKLDDENFLGDASKEINSNDDDEDEPFDDTLEQLMTLDNSQNAGASMITDNGDQGAGGGQPQQKKDDEAKNSVNESQHSLRKVIRILRFLQLLVEGHYSMMQDHLREQRMGDGQINPKSFDFVAFISTMLGVFEKQYVNCYSCELGYQMIDTLIELIQGPCKDNQRTLVSSKVIDNCRDLISQGSSDRELKIKGFVGDKLALLNGLKSKSVKLLLSIIEGPIDQEIMRSITISMDDFVVVFERIQYVFLEFVKNHLNLDPEQVLVEDIQDSLMKDSFDNDEVQEGFDLFILIKTLADCNPSVQSIVEGFQDHPYYHFFTTNTGYIEILLDADTLQRVYFPIKPVCRFLSKQSRQALMIQIDRTSPQQKIIGLLRAVPELVDEMHHIEVLSRSSIQITPTRLNFLRDISNLIAVTVSALVLVFYEYGLELDSEGDASIGPIVNKDIERVIKIIGYIQFCTAISLLIGQLITRAHLIIKSGWRSYVERNRIKYQNLINSKKEGSEDSSYAVIKANSLSLLDARMLLLTQGPDAEEFIVDEAPPDSNKRDFGHVILRIEYLWTCTSFVLGNGQVLFLIIYGCLSLLGLFQSPIFYAMQLLDIINRFPSLTNVVRAITVNKNQLLMTAMLELILIWIYCVLLFTFFYDHYFNDDIQYNDTEKGDCVCRNLFHCYVSTLNFGLRAGGGIGDFLPSNSYFNDSLSVYYIRAANDLSFFLIIIVMFFNIIFGIIIDTFASLRDEKAEMDDDMRNICFICSIDRQSVDKDSEEGFVHHIKKEHNLWQYVFFIIHLNTKDETDYNGTESFIAGKLAADDISWFPFNKAICLEKEKYLIAEK